MPVYWATKPSSGGARKKTMNVTWPIALDPTKRTFHSWQEGPTAHWPRIYLLDRTLAPSSKVRAYVTGRRTSFSSSASPIIRRARC